MSVLLMESSILSEVRNDLDSQDGALRSAIANCYPPATQPPGSRHPAQRGRSGATSCPGSPPGRRERMAKTYLKVVTE